MSMAFAVELGWCMGAPDLADDPGAWSWPRVRARLCTMRGAVPTANVWRGAGPAALLLRTPGEAIDAVRFTPLGGSEAMHGDASLAAHRTDGMLVPHRGRVVRERYDGPSRAELPHVCMSVTKSPVGTAAAAQVAVGRIEPAAPVSAYVAGLLLRAGASVPCGGSRATRRRRGHARHPRPGRLHRSESGERRAEMVIARFASHPGAGNANLDPITLAAYQAMAQHLVASP